MKLVTMLTVALVLSLAMLFGCISYNSYINRNKEHVYTPEEISAIECAKRGGNLATRNGWEDNIYVREYKCEGVDDVRN